MSIDTIDTIDKIEIEDSQYFDSRYPLAHQLAMSFARTCKRPHCPIIEQSLALLLQALECGEISLNMTQALTKVSIQSLTAWKKHLIDIK